jgi:hypothetical protein
MAKKKPYNIDADQRNADWLRTLHWDLPTDKDTFLAVIGGEDALEHFMTLPAAEAMPDALKQALNAGVPEQVSNPVSNDQTNIVEPPTRKPVLGGKRWRAEPRA